MKPEVVTNPPIRQDIIGFCLVVPLLLLSVLSGIFFMVAATDKISEVLAGLADVPVDAPHIDMATTEPSVDDAQPDFSTTIDFSTTSSAMMEPERFTGTVTLGNAAMTVEGVESGTDNIHFNGDSWFNGRLVIKTVEGRFATLSIRGGKLVVADLVELKTGSVAND